MRDMSFSQFPVIPRGIIQRLPAGTPNHPHLADIRSSRGAVDYDEAASNTSSVRRTELQHALKDELWKHRRTRRKLRNETRRRKSLECEVQGVKLRYAQLATRWTDSCRQYAICDAARVALIHEVQVLQNRSCAGDSEAFLVPVSIARLHRRCR